MKRPTTYCDSCESVVYADDVHSCYDAKAVRHDKAVQDAREAVVQKAQEWVLVCNAHWADSSWHSRCRAGDELTAAVRHLATLTATEGTRDARD